MYVLVPPQFRVLLHIDLPPSRPLEGHYSALHTPLSFTLSTSFFGRERLPDLGCCAFVTESIFFRIGPTACEGLRLLPDADGVCRCCAGVQQPKAIITDCVSLGTPAEEA